MSRQASTVQSSWASSLPSSVSSPPDPAPQPEFGCETPKSATRHARSAAYAASAASAARSLRKRTAAKLRDAFAQRRRIVRPRIAGLAGQSSSEVAQYPTASTSRPVTISTPSRVLLMLSMGLAEHACTSMALAELGRRCDEFLVFFFTTENSSSKREDQSTGPRAAALTQVHQKEYKSRVTADCGSDWHYTRHGRKKKKGRRVSAKYFHFLPKLKVLV